jgi:NTP pyrophosphatase (non-canonical NTP hydrolase)
MKQDSAHSYYPFDDYQKDAARTANHDHEKILTRLKEHPELIELTNYALGISGEAGEIADHVKKVVFHGHDLQVEELLKECGDELWYVANAARMLKAKLSTVALMNVDKLKKRYPEGFDENKSIHRTE